MVLVQGHEIIIYGQTYSLVPRPDYPPTCLERKGWKDFTCDAVPLLLSLEALHILLDAESYFTGSTTPALTTTWTTRIPWQHYLSFQ